MKDYWEEYGMKSGWYLVEYRNVSTGKMYSHAWNITAGGNLKHLLTQCMDGWEITNVYLCQSGKKARDLARYTNSGLEVHGQYECMQTPDEASE